MLNFSVALLSFCFFLGLGHVLMFLESVSYYLIIPCLFYLIILRYVYHEATCRTVEVRDLVVCLFASLLFYAIYHSIASQSGFSLFTYIYLITFVTTMVFVSSIRFKSLM